MGYSLAQLLKLRWADHAMLSNYCIDQFKRREIESGVVDPDLSWRNLFRAAEYELFRSTFLYPHLLRSPIQVE